MAAASMEPGQSLMSLREESRVPPQCLALWESGPVPSQVTTSGGRACLGGEKELGAGHILCLRPSIC